MGNNRFVKKYPVSLVEVIFTVISFAENAGRFFPLPGPTSSGIADSAEFAGFSNSALRTALSRGKKTKMFESIEDGGRTRFKMNAMATMVKDRMAGTGGNTGYTVTVYSSRKKNENERHLLRVILKNFGFKQMIHNVYVNTRVDSNRLFQELENNGLAQSLYLIDCETIKGKEIEKDIAAFWNLDKRSRAQKAFLEDLKEFLRGEGLMDREIFCRFNYAGAAFYRYILMDEPYLPPDCYPSDYALERIRDFYQGFSMKYMKNLLRYYTEANS